MSNISRNDRTLAPWLIAIALSGAAACYGGGPLGSSSSNNNANNNSSGSDGGTSTTGPLPFTPDPPNVYVAKVKNLLVGLPPTDAEIKAVEADASQLSTLVDTWMQMPEYDAKMLRFFELAFQQTQVAPADFEAQLQPGQLQLDGNKNTQALMLQNQEELFARTMLASAAANQPFNQAISTQTYMMTTAMKVFYALTDVWQLDNTPTGVNDAFSNANPTLSLTVETATAIPLSETLDVTSANYMHWYDPTATGGGCTTIKYPAPARSNILYDILMGVYLTTGSCKNTQGNGQLTAADFADWTPVTIRQPSGGEATSNFYDLVTLRAASALVLKRPYLGYFTTPAFFANWQTNQSNQMRVTINQSLIVATGAQIDGTDPTVPSSTPGLDTVHALGPCVGCHQLLDPTRSIFASTFSWYYGTQLDPTYASQPGLFAFEGVQAPMHTLYDFGKTISGHPLVASGWAQKLCYYMDSEACVPTDPEFQNIVKLFQTSYSWNALVKAVAISPITTHAATTLTATTNGEVVAVSRRDHLCAALNARLGFADVCGLNAALPDVAPVNALAIVPGLPSDGYGRGSTIPVLPNQPSLFYRAGVENFCELIAPLIIDAKNPPTGAKTWSSADPTSAISDFVNLIIGLPPSDPRAAPVQAALQAHYTSAISTSGDAGAAATPTQALQSTFIAACLAPSTVSMGM